MPSPEFDNRLIAASLHAKHRELSDESDVVLDIHLEVFVTDNCRAFLDDARELLR